MQRFLIAAVCGLGIGVGVSLAGPLNKANVDAGAKWLVHVDIEAGMASTAGKFVAEHRAEMKIEPLEAFQKQTGLDALTDIKGITVYGTSAVADEGVAIVHGTAKIEEAVDRLMSEDKTVQQLEVAGKPVYQWTEKGSERFGFLKKDGGATDRWFIVSKDRESLEKAMSVIGGTAPSLGAEGKGAMARSPRDHSIVFVSMCELDKAKVEHAPKVLRTAQELSAEIGEDGDGVYGELRLRAGAAEDIKNIADFAKGLIALGRIASAGDPDAKEISQAFDALKIEASGVDLTASFRVSKEVLKEAMVALKEHEAESKKPAPKIEKTSTPKKGDKR